MELRQLLRCKLDAYKIYKQDNNATARDSYVAARNKYNKRVRTAKREHASIMVLKIDRMSGRPWWKTVNSALGRGVKNNIIPALNTDHDLIQDDGLKAEHFNRFFAEKSSVPDPYREVESIPTSPANPPGLSNIHFRPKIGIKSRIVLKNHNLTKNGRIDLIFGFLCVSEKMELSWIGFKKKFFLKNFHFPQVICNNFSNIPLVITRRKMVTLN